MEIFSQSALTNQQKTVTIQTKAAHKGKEKVSEK
jgi:hypothetical protein